MMQSWEEVRSSFGSRSDDEHCVHMPGIRDDEERKVEDGYHAMKKYILPLPFSNKLANLISLIIISYCSGDVQAIFNPVVDRIIELVMEQVFRVQNNVDSVAVREAFTLFNRAVLFGTNSMTLRRLCSWANSVPRNIF